MTADEAAELAKFRQNIAAADLPDFCGVAASCLDELVDTLRDAKAPTVTIEMTIVVALQLRAWQRHIERPTVQQVGNA